VYLIYKLLTLKLRLDTFFYDNKYFILALYHDTKNCTKKENRTVQERNILKTTL